MELRNESENKFIDISSERYREYVFPTGSVTIFNPSLLSVSESNGHRILDEKGECHFIPSGWIQLTWRVKEGSPHFVK